ncbi:hotdog family protein [Mucilaginibacter auburnensis]|uniref:3-hydroxyacyl-[acyl-carrier-protein] dehydratase n=1 Tax=Mucilaginibacter auburnensis TaxID=1457233 RepID=A0A2H9VMJ0_9SPHI|nr:hypothetical protein [Mucilaginibacter auburnensis]PJJ79557.1 3-hydroxyacyl-[acyl-carrier-protein] dehydratase [Mucilaginibacter auburnensis]
MIKPVFDILTLTQGENNISAALAINADSQIFDGHFPGHPVVPGACMLQLVKDLLSETLRVSPKMLKADNIKFLGLVQPGVEGLNLNVNYQLTDSQIKLAATLSSADTTYMKLQGSLAI